MSQGKGFNHIAITWSKELEEPGLKHQLTSRRIEVGNLSDWYES